MALARRSFKDGTANRHAPARMTCQERFDGFFADQKNSRSQVARAHHAQPDLVDLLAAAGLGGYRSPALRSRLLDARPGRAIEPGRAHGRSAGDDRAGQTMAAGKRVAVSGPGECAGARGEEGSARG